MVTPAPSLPILHLPHPLTPQSYPHDLVSPFLSLSHPSFSLSSETPRASPRDMGPLVWGAVGGTLLVLLLLAGGSFAFILLRVRRRRKSPGGAGGGASGDGGFYDPKTQVLGNGDPVFWTPVVPGPMEPDGKEEEEEEEKAEKGLMLPPPPALEDDMESQLDGSLISRRAVYV
ncbi:PREDICTED: uncharacterized protein LOC105526906 [Colobus angolensis palliatus]|uniref:uncharacterized protein LOC105526906 n=1 Tax=Colobus angolensis palliatus TaxID=336983 RepID=UPI0005F3BA65|nr:PREDICTED: uncharacterized protein LOC105526906 [Colobus angolensis palliatus]